MSQPDVNDVHYTGEIPVEEDESLTPEDQLTDAEAETLRVQDEAVRNGS